MSSAGDVIDLAVIENLRDLGGGDDAFLNELISTYLEETPQLLEKLQLALASSDAGGVRLNAHSLKGSSAEFGAAYLAELCRQTEQAGKDQDLADLPELLTEIEREYRLVDSALRQIMGSQD